MVESREDVHQVVNEFLRAFDKRGLKINVGKSRALSVTKDKRMNGWIGSAGGWGCNGRSASNDI